MSPSMMPTRLPQLRQRDGQVDGDGGLADAALAGADGDDVADAGDRRAAALRAAPPTARSPSSRSRRRSRRRRRGRRRRLIAQQILHRTGRRRQLDRERRRAPPSIATFFTKPSADDVLVEVGILDDAQRVEDGGLRHRRRTGEHPAIVPCRRAHARSDGQTCFSATSPMIGQLEALALERLEHAEEPQAEQPEREQRPAEEADDAGDPAEERDPPENASRRPCRRSRRRSPRPTPASTASRGTSRTGSRSRWRRTPRR